MSQNEFKHGIDNFSKAGDNKCYMHSVYQALFHTPGFISALNLLINDVSSRLREVNIDISDIHSHKGYTEGLMFLIDMCSMVFDSVQI